MDAGKRSRLEASGYKIGTFRDLLGMSDEEAKLVRLRIRLAQEIRSLRKAKGMTQIDLAKILKSSQSRVAKMEAPSPTASLDQLFKAFFLVGGEFSVIESHQRPNAEQSKKRPADPISARIRSRETVPK